MIFSKIQLTQQVKDELLELFKKDNGENPTWQDWIGNRYYLTDTHSEQELMLRVTDYKLTIARINFNNTNKGLGTQLLHILSGFAKDNNISIIEIEMAQTIEIVNFCLKNNFSITPPFIEHEGHKYGNYSKEIKNTTT